MPVVVSNLDTSRAVDIAYDTAGLIVFEVLAWDALVMPVVMTRLKKRD